MEEIKEFVGVYRFLSNFYECPVVYEGWTFTSSEAAFQAAKCANPSDVPLFTSLDPAQSKRRGRKVALRDDWHKVKDDAMRAVLVAKFDQNPDLKQQLLETEEALLEEGNWWKDRYWGVCEGKGENKLGILLMELRQAYMDNGEAGYE